MSIRKSVKIEPKKKFFLRYLRREIFHFNHIKILNISLKISVAVVVSPSCKNDVIRVVKLVCATDYNRMRFQVYGKYRLSIRCVSLYTYICIYVCLRIESYRCESNRISSLQLLPGPPPSYSPRKFPSSAPTLYLYSNKAWLAHQNGRGHIFVFQSSLFTCLFAAACNQKQLLNGFSSCFLLFLHFPFSQSFIHSSDQFENNM